MNQQLKQISKQTQLIDQNYSNGIMLNCIAALENLAFFYRYPGKKRIFDYYSGYAHRHNEKELINAIVIQLEIFRASHYNYSQIYSDYDFPKNLTKEQIIYKISEWKNYIPYQNIQKFYDEIIYYLNGSSDVSRISDIIEEKKKEWGPTTEKQLYQVGRSAPYINTMIHNQREKIIQAYNKDGHCEITANLDINRGDDVDMKNCYESEQHFNEHEKKFHDMESTIESIFINLTEKGCVVGDHKVWLKENISYFKKGIDSIPFVENEAQQKIKKYEDFKKKIKKNMKDKNDSDFFSKICEDIINCYSRGNNTSER